MNDASWRLHRLEWSLRAKQEAFRHLVNDARAQIRRALDQAPFAISWSAGKDSTAMTHLVRSIAPETPIIIQFDDCDWPTKRSYVHRVVEAFGWWDYHTVEPSFSVWEAASRAALGAEDICAPEHALTRDGFLRPLQEKQAELGCTGVFLGLRIAESKARRMHLASRGPLYRLKSGEWRCCPIWRWEASDVFAYHVQQGLEINPCYLQNRFRTPEEIRLSWALPTPSGLVHGDLQHMRHYYPEQFQRLRNLGVA